MNDGAEEEIGGGGENSSGSGGVAGIVNGSPAARGEFPGYAHPNVRESFFLCGAVVNHEDLLLTAGHCASLWAGVDIYIGATQLDGSDAAETIRGEFVAIHPDYYFREEPLFVLDNDVLLVKLATPSSAPVSIVNADPDTPADSARLGLQGFGYSGPDGGASDVLLKAESRIIGDAECARRDDLLGGYGSFKPDIMFCDFGDKNESTWLGDSGSPVYDVSNGTVVGIVSFGASPIVYAPNGFSVKARASAFFDWIRSGICALSSNPPPGCVITDAWFGDSVAAAPGEFPSYVRDRGEGFCAGILVAPDVVLTAASCDPGVFLTHGVYIGFSEKSDVDSAEGSDVQGVFPVEGYDRDAAVIRNDLALLKLAKASAKPFTPISSSSPAVGSEIIKLGFGDNYFALRSKVLRKLEMSVAGKLQCATKYTELGIESEAELVRSGQRFCVGPEDTDVCIHELGGPVLDSSGRVVGMSSVYDGCHFDGYPSSITDVSVNADELYAGICDISSTPPPICEELSTCDAWLLGTGTILSFSLDFFGLFSFCFDWCFVFLPGLFDFFGWDRGRCPPSFVIE